MSVIWELVRVYELGEFNRRPEHLDEIASERRRSLRRVLYVPLFVYGYTSENEPFHQETNTLEVNANGGLLHLDGYATVRRGQKLLLTNRLSTEEKECYVVTLAQKPNRTDLRVGISFAKSALEFWTASKESLAKRASVAIANS